MFAMWCVLSAIILLEGIFTLGKVFRFRNFFIKEISKPPVSRDQWPKVALLAPCKGIDPNLRENINSWFAQQYSGFKLFFIVESENDPAMEVLHDFPQAEIMVAGLAQGCGQKVHNLRYAIERISPSFEVLLFVDSDCLLLPDWMRNLVNQVLETPQGAATGYRWFTCQKSFGSLLRAAWNSSVLTLYEENGKNNFAWGGSMGILRSTFESSCVLEFWTGSISDDYGLTNALKNSGGFVQFVPGAIAQTTTCEDLAIFLRWAFRQLLITRVYYPRLWLAAFLFHAVWLLWIVTGLFFPFYFFPVFLIVQILQSIKANLRLQCVPIGRPILFWLMGPVVGLCNSMLLFATLLTRRVVWRGVEYVLFSKNRVTIRPRRAR